MDVEYYKKNGIEAIDVIEAFDLGFHLGNVVKYILRAGRKSKNVIDDLMKAKDYIDREIALITANAKLYKEESERTRNSNPV